MIILVVTSQHPGWGDFQQKHHLSSFESAGLLSVDHNGHGCNMHLKVRVTRLIPRVRHGGEKKTLLIFHEMLHTTGLYFILYIP